MEWPAASANGGRPGPICRRYHVVLALACQLASCWLPLPLSADQAVAMPPEKIDAETFESWFQDVSNWGRWGAEDQRGTLNLITPDVRIAAAREVRAGLSVSLARTVEKARAIDNPLPFTHAMIGVGTPVGEGEQLVHGYGADRFEVSFHGFVHTHIDALCHIFHRGSMYNGVSQERVTPRGAEALSVLNMKDGILTRAVLIDLPKLLGVEYLDDQHAVSVEELERWESASGISIEPGDAVILRTGRWLKREIEGPWDPMQGTAGLHPRVAIWLKQRDVALVGSDSTMDFLPSLVEGSPFPFHELAIAGMGMPILDALDLEALSTTAARLGRNRFMLYLAPLAVPGATGSPVNPVATF